MDIFFSTIGLILFLFFIFKGDDVWEFIKQVTYKVLGIEGSEEDYDEEDYDDVGYYPTKNHPSHWTRRKLRKSNIN